MKPPLLQMQPSGTGGRAFGTPWALPVVRAEKGQPGWSRPHKPGPSLEPGPGGVTSRSVGLLEVDKSKQKSVFRGGDFCVSVYGKSTANAAWSGKGASVYPPARCSVVRGVPQRKRTRWVLGVPTSSLTKSRGIFTAVSPRGALIREGCR